jgi:hypothetical protein
VVGEGVGQWDEVPCVRYRKSFDAPAHERAADLAALEGRTQRSVVIITANHLVEGVVPAVVEI